jgi:hypothetical protein
VLDPWAPLRSRRSRFRVGEFLEVPRKQQKIRVRGRTIPVNLIAPIPSVQHVRRRRPIASVRRSRCRRSRGRTIRPQHSLFSDRRYRLGQVYGPSCIVHRPLTVSEAFLETIEARDAVRIWFTTRLPWRRTARLDDRVRTAPTIAQLLTISESICFFFFLLSRSNMCTHRLKRNHYGDTLENVGHRVSVDRRSTRILKNRLFVLRQNRTRVRCGILRSSGDALKSTATVISILIRSPET